MLVNICKSILLLLLQRKRRLLLLQRKRRLLLPVKVGKATSLLLLWQELLLIKVSKASLQLLLRCGRRLLLQKEATAAAAASIARNPSQLWKGIHSGWLLIKVGKATMLLLQRRRTLLI